MELAGGAVPELLRCDGQGRQRGRSFAPDGLLPRVAEVERDSKLGGRGTERDRGIASVSRDPVAT
jgi:hypothetical protein